MRILLTGGSSFTGLWFARSLAARGHAVVAPLKGSDYSACASSRLGVACPVTLLQQEDFTEPMVRINTDRIDGAGLDWSETSAWDAEAEFYRQAAK